MTKSLEVKEGAILPKNATHSLGYLDGGFVKKLCSRDGAMDCAPFPLAEAKLLSICGPIDFLLDVISDYIVLLVKTADLFGFRRHW